MTSPWGNAPPPEIDPRDKMIFEIAEVFEKYQPGPPEAIDILVTMAAQIIVAGLRPEGHMSAAMTTAQLLLRRALQLSERKGQ